MFSYIYNRRRILLFLLVAGLHGALLCFLSFSVKTELGPSPEPAVKTIRLVNIQEAIPPPSPLLPPPLPKIQAPPKRLPTIPQSTSEPVAETLIGIEESLPASEPVPVLPQNTLVSTGAEPKPGKQEDEAALRNAYIKKNFTYIQRRIKEKLVYPFQAKRAGIQGLTEVVFTIHPDGSVSNVSVKVSSGQAILDQAAVDAIHTSAPFYPPPQVQVKIVYPVAFKLR
jgi:protein TonB